MYRHHYCVSSSHDSIIILVKINLKLINLLRLQWLVWMIRRHDSVPFPHNPCENKYKVYQFTMKFTTSVITSLTVGRRIRIIFLLQENDSYSTTRRGLNDNCLRRQMFSVYMYIYICYIYNRPRVVLHIVIVYYFHIVASSSFWKYM